MHFCIVLPKQYVHTFFVCPCTTFTLSFVLSVLLYNVFELFFVAVRRPSFFVSVAYVLCLPLLLLPLLSSRCRVLLVREEALAGISDLAWYRLPAPARSSTTTAAVPSFARRLAMQMDYVTDTAREWATGLGPALQRQVAKGISHLAKLGLVRTSGGDDGDAGGVDDGMDESTTGTPTPKQHPIVIPTSTRAAWLRADRFGYKQLMLAVTRAGKVFALHTDKVLRVCDWPLMVVVVVVVVEEEVVDV